MSEYAFSVEKRSSGYHLHDQHLDLRVEGRDLVELFGQWGTQSDGRRDKNMAWLSVALYQAIEQFCGKWDEPSYSNGPELDDQCVQEAIEHVVHFGIHAETRRVQKKADSPQL